MKTHTVRVYGRKLLRSLHFKCVTAASSYDKQYESDSKYVESGCLESNCYRFAIEDSFGDGLCCSYWAGSYSLKISGSEVGSGGDFMSREETLFGTCKSLEFQKDMADQAVAKKDQKE